jgi:hypothetical protein
MLKHFVLLFALCVTNVAALEKEQYPNVQHEGTPTGDVKVIENGTPLILRIVIVC